MFSHVELPETKALRRLVECARIALSESIAQVKYPARLRCPSGADVWQQMSGELKTINRDILEGVSGRAGVYALFCARKSQEWQLKYIGQSAAKFSKSRICAHLVWRNKDTTSGRFTGSKFDEVQASVLSRKDIAVSFVEIRPAALRHFVEASLIAMKQPEWNFHGTTLLGQRKSTHHCQI